MALRFFMLTASLAIVPATLVGCAPDSPTPTLAGVGPLACTTIRG